MAEAKHDPKAGWTSIGNYIWQRIAVISKNAPLFDTIECEQRAKEETVRALEERQKLEMRCKTEDEAVHEGFARPEWRFHGIDVNVNTITLLENANTVTLRGTFFPCGKLYGVEVRERPAGPAPPEAGRDAKKKAPAPEAAAKGANQALQQPAPAPVKEQPQALPPNADAHDKVRPPEAQQFDDQPPVAKTLAVKEAPSPDQFPELELSGHEKNLVYAALKRHFKLSELRPHKKSGLKIESIEQRLVERGVNFSVGTLRRVLTELRAALRRR